MSTRSTSKSKKRVRPATPTLDIEPSIDNIALEIRKLLLIALGKAYYIEDPGKMALVLQRCTSALGTIITVDKLKLLDDKEIERLTTDQLKEYAESLIGSLN